MDTTIVARIVYTLIAIAIYALMHFGLVPTDAGTLLIGGLGGAAAVSGTFVPKKTDTSVPTQGSVVTNNTPTRG